MSHFQSSMNMRMMMNIIDVWMHICFYFIFRRWVIVDVLWRWIIKINWFAGLWNRSKTNAKYFINIQTGHYTTQWKQFSRLMLGLGSLKKKKRACMQIYKLPSMLFLHSTLHQYMVSWLTLHSSLTRRIVLSLKWKAWLLRGEFVVN